ncbi:MAG: hypothetical protein FK732_03405, partial [Asgard group archaeon]|nr:hypothetical protein [Asgard group archaeon]
MSKKFSVLIIGVIITSILVLSKDKYNGNGFDIIKKESEITPENIMPPIYRYYDMVTADDYVYLLLINGIEIWVAQDPIYVGNYNGNETCIRIIENNSYVYVMTQDGFQIIYAPHPAAMEIVCDYNINSTNTISSRNFFLNDSYLYLFYHEYETHEYYIEIINIGNKTDPYREAKYQVIEIMGYCYSMKFHQQNVYLLFSRGLCVYNFDNFSDPQLISTYNMSINGYNNRFYSLVFENNYALIGSENGIVILDLSNITDVTLHKHF